MIYAVIRIVATNLPCRWCIMIATTDRYVHANALSMAIREVGFYKKGSRCSMIATPINTVRDGTLVTYYPRIRVFEAYCVFSNLPATNHSGGRFVRVFQDDRSIEPLSKPFAASSQSHSRRSMLGLRNCP